MTFKKSLKAVHGLGIYVKLIRPSFKYVAYDANKLYRFRVRKFIQCTTGRRKVTKLGGAQCALLKNPRSEKN